MKIQRVNLDTAAGHQFLEDAKSIDKDCLPGCVWYPADFLWIALDGSKVVGYAALAKSQQWSNCGYLCRAGIIPKYRGLGLQKRLIQARCNFSKRLNWVAVITDTRRNPASANSLIACGFKIYEPSNPWAFGDSIYWRKWL